MYYYESLEWYSFDILLYRQTHCLYYNKCHILTSVKLSLWSYRVNTAPPTDRGFSFRLFTCLPKKHITARLHCISGIYVVWIIFLHIFFFCIDQHEHVKRISLLNIRFFLLHFYPKLLILLLRLFCSKGSHSTFTFYTIDCEYMCLILVRRRSQ